MDVNPFIDAVVYVNNNQELWDRMISLCHNEWNLEVSDGRLFEEYVLELYGIKICPLTYNQLNYHVIDPKKYLLFQIKFS